MNKIYYALKHKSGSFYHRKGSPTPALFTTENMANATLKKARPFSSDEYKVTKFAEVE